MGRKNITLLILVVILGAVLRGVLLTWNPPSLNWDEVSHGYNAFSVLKTGMDQWGQKFPIFNFRAYGDYPTTLNLYLTIPFVAIFGLTELAIRLPHVILGILTIVSVYFLTFGLTKKYKASLFCAFLVAIEPWFVFTSRFVLQSNLSVFLLITAGAFFVNRDKSKHFVALSLFSIFLTLFSYHTTRIFSPLLLLGACLIYRDEIINKIIYLFVALFIGLSAYILINPGATARGNVLFIIDQGAINRIIESRQTSKLPRIITKLVYNRPVYFVEQFSTKYISYFSPRFLFLKGGTQYQFNVPNFGLIYPIGLPFFYLGLVLLVIKSIKDKNYRFILLWLLLSPIPASLTNESFTVIRATTMLPIPEILITLAIFWISGKMKERSRLWIILPYILLTLAFAESYFVNYFSSYRNDYSWSWQYGYKEVAAYARANYSKYDKIIVTKKYGEPHEFFLFFLKYDPAKYQTDSNAVKFFQSNWYWVDRFDKYYFMNDWQIKTNSAAMSSIQQRFVMESGTLINCNKIKCLLITSPDNAPAGWKKLDKINFLDGKPAFEMYDNIK